MLVALTLFFSSSSLWGQQRDADAMEDFAVTLAQAFNQGSADVFDRAFDVDIVAHRAVAYLEETFEPAISRDPGFRQYLSQVMGNFKQPQRVRAFGADLVNSYKKDKERVSFLRLRMGQKEGSAILRVAKQGKVNYQEFVIAKDAKGRLRIVDLFSFTDGLYYSQDLVISALSNYCRLDDLVSNHLGMPGFAMIEEISKATKSGDYEKGNRLIEEVKSPLREHEVFMAATLSHYMAQTGKGLYKKVQYYKDKFPKHPLLLLSRTFAEANYGSIAEAFDAVEKLDVAVGGDPYLNLFRGNLWRHQKEFDKAYEAFGNALRVADAQPIAHMEMAYNCYRRKDFEGLVTHLKKMEILNGYEISLESLAKGGKFQGFAESEAFAKWKKEKEAAAKVKQK